MIGVDKVYCGDCAEVLSLIGDGEVDAIVTDPPAGIGFYGAGWDGDKGGRDSWVGWLSGIFRECLRVLKPGGYLLSWALPRTSHWTGWALEGAGFEVRDVVTHFFSQGYPKGGDLGKEIDKRAGVVRKSAGVYLDPGSFRERLSGGCFSTGGEAGVLRSKCSMTLPVTEEAARWDGWGVGLKPAVEFWWLGRKPFEGKGVRLADNVLKHGVGALNISGVRMEVDASEYEEGYRRLVAVAENPELAEAVLGDSGAVKVLKRQIRGRYPSNFIFSDVRVWVHGESGRAVLEEEYREAVSRGEGAGYEPWSFSGPVDRLMERFSFSGESLFKLFYRLPADLDNLLCGYFPKPSREERHGAVEGGRNVHPTVKSVHLMEYLINLVSRDDQLILDPFAGSGTTLVAAKGLGRHFVGIDLSMEYVEIASQRLSRVLGAFGEACGAGSYVGNLEGTEKNKTGGILGCLQEE